MNFQPPFIPYGHPGYPQQYNAPPPVPYSFPLNPNLNGIHGYSPHPQLPPLQQPPPGLPPPGFPPLLNPLFPINNGFQPHPPSLWQHPNHRTSQPPSIASVSPGQTSVDLPVAEKQRSDIDDYWKELIGPLPGRTSDSTLLSKLPSKAVTISTPNGLTMDPWKRDSWPHLLPPKSYNLPSTSASEPSLTESLSRTPSEVGPSLRLY
jgi:hypothetical protein